MKITTKILGVKDGDAIIITLQKEKKNLVILIDSGEKSYFQKVISELENVLKPLSKAAPDLIVCTHYDNDHINGMTEIIEYFVNKKSKIGQVWLHRPAMGINQLITEAIQYHKRKIDIIPSYSAFILKENFKAAGILPEAEFIIEGIPELKDLVAVIDSHKIPIHEPFTGYQFLPDWPEIEVLVPSTSFFIKLFPLGISTEKFVKDEVEFNLLCETKSVKDDKMTPCEILDQNSSKKGVSKTNMASIIICINVDGKKFLFTGDADIKSFKNIQDYESKLADIYFLKIPHHASRNNLSSELITIMNPSFAYVSGDKYIDEEVLGCLKAKGADVKVTTTPDTNVSFSFGK